MTGPPRIDPALVRAAQRGDRIAFLGGVRLPGLRLIDPLLRPPGRTLALRPIGRLEDRLRGR